MGALRVTRFYAAIDAADLGPGLATDRGDTIVRCELDGADRHRMAVAQFAQADDRHDVEFIVWAPSGGEGTVGVANLYVGISQPGAQRNRYVGEQASGFGLRLDDGKVYSNNAVVATFVPVALGVVIRLRVDVAAGACSWFADDTLVGTVAIPTGQSWVYAVTVSGGAAGSVLCFCNAGQQALTTQDTSATGWWQESPQLSPIELSSQDYLSQPTDAEPHRRFQRMLSEGSIDNTLSLAFWPDSADEGSAIGGSVGSVDIVDAQRMVVPLLLSNDVRDQPVTLLAVDEGGSLDEAQSVAYCVVDHAERVGGRNARLMLRDASVELAVPLQPRLVLPNAEPSAVDTAWPATLGAVRSAKLKLIDAVLRRHAVSHQPVAGIATVRHNGRPLDPNALIPDYTLTADGTCVDLAEDLQGRVTMDLTAQGQFHPGSGGVDLLAGGGRFDDMHSTSEVATHWTRGGGAATGGASNAAFWPLWNNSGTGIGRVDLMGSATPFTAQSWLVTPTNIIQAGRSYRVRIYIEYIPGIDNRGLQDYLVLTGRPDMIGPPTEWKRWQNDAPFITGVYADAGVQEAVFRNGEAEDLPLAIQLVAPVNGKARVRWVELYELPSATDVPELDGIPLAEYARQVLSLARCREDLCDLESAKLIDDATGYLYGTQITETTTADAALALALRSCAATIVPRRSGGFAFARFLDPDEVDDGELGIELTESMLLSKPRQWMDLAPGLTSSAVGGRNIERYSDADFGDDFDPDTGVPMSVRKLLSDEYRWRVSSSIQLAGCYRHALSARPLQTIFDKPEHGRAALDHVLRSYRVQRYFGSIEIARPRGVPLNPGAVHRFSYREWDFDGRKVHLRSVSTPDSPSITLTIWSH